MDLLLVEARTLDIVTQAQVRTMFPGLRERLASVAEAYYVAELVDRFCANSKSRLAYFHCCSRH